MIAVHIMMCMSYKGGLFGPRLVLSQEFSFKILDQSGGIILLPHPPTLRKLIFQSIKQTWMIQKHISCLKGFTISARYFPRFHVAWGTRRICVHLFMLLWQTDTSWPNRWPADRLASVQCSNVWVGSETTTGWPRWLLLMWNGGLNPLRRQY